MDKHAKKRGIQAIRILMSSKAIDLMPKNAKQLLAVEKWKQERDVFLDDK